MPLRVLRHGDREVGGIPGRLNIRGYRRVFQGHDGYELTVLMKTYIGWLPGLRVALVLLAFSSLAIVGCNRGSGQETTQGGGRGGRGGSGLPVPVEVARAELGTAARFITATGTVEPLRTIAINAQASGALLSVNVQEGTAVRAGTLLAQVDSRELTAQMASARANLEVVQRAAERSQQLRDQQIITVAEYERDQAALTAARATFEQLETRLGYATIRSPIAGVVLEKRVETGDIVSPQTRLFTVGDISTLVVRVPISELDVAGLSVGDVVDVTLDALPDRSIQGRVLRVFPSADTVTRLVPVEVALSGSSGRAVRPGFLARVSLRLDPRTNVLMVPAAALLEDPAGAVVYLVQNGKASRRRVRRGGTYQGRVEIVDGISEGDVVIVAGNSMVREGSDVRIIDAKTGSSPSTIGSDASTSAPTTAEAVR